MRREKKEVKLTVTEIEMNVNGSCVYSPKRCNYRYTIESDHYIEKENFKGFIEVDIPETFKEFKKKNGVTNTQILEYLNENFNK